MKKSFLFPYIFLVITTLSCVDDSQDASVILDKSIQAHGSDLAANARFSFNFRGIDYSVDRKGGIFVYERRFKQNNAAVVDRWNNDGFSRRINDSIVQLPDSLSQRYRASLNSVIYFAQLPYSLDGPAVNLKHIGTSSIAGKQYHKIEVTFKENGGGEDHEDVFIYWINTQDHLVDYLAYSYCEDDCGYRFRESVNRRNLEGVIVQDYNNYRPASNDVELSELDEAFESGSLILMSEIKTEFPEVILNP